jgi:hypothetical protein
MKSKPFTSSRHQHSDPGQLVEWKLENEGTEPDSALAQARTNASSEELSGEPEKENIGGVCRPSSPNCGPDT